MFGNFEEREHYNPYAPQGYYPQPGGYYPPPTPPGYYPPPGGYYPPPAGGYGGDPYGRDPYGRNPYGRDPYDRGPSFTNVVLALSLFFVLGYLAAYKGCNSNQTDGNMDAAKTSYTNSNRQSNDPDYVEPEKGSIIYDPDKQQAGQPPTVHRDEGVTVQTKVLPPTPVATNWVLLLDKFADKDKAEHFQQTYQNRAIEICTMTNGEFWAIIDLDTEEDCNIEKKDWLRHPRDSKGLVLKVTQI